MSVSLSTSTVRSGQRSSSAQDPAPVALDEEPDDGFHSAPRAAHRDQPDGTRAWVFRYRRDGKPHWGMLGKPGAVKADDACAAALPSSPARRALANSLAFPLPADAKDVRRRVDGRERYPARIRPSPRRLGCARRYRPLPPRYGREMLGGANRCHEMPRRMFGCASAWDHQLVTADGAPVETGRMRGGAITLAIAAVVAAAMVVYFFPYRSSARNSDAGIVDDPAFPCSVALGGRR